MQENSMSLPAFGTNFRIQGASRTIFRVIGGFLNATTSSLKRVNEIIFRVKFLGLQKIFILLASPFRKEKLKYTRPAECIGPVGRQHKGIKGIDRPFGRGVESILI
jgi:hypothetical protein